MAEMRARDIVLNADRPVLTCWRNYSPTSVLAQIAETEQIAQTEVTGEAGSHRDARFDLDGTPPPEVVVDRRDGPSAHDENCDERRRRL